MLYQAILFDFDGTIADTSPGIYESIRYAMRRMERDPLLPDEMRQFIGPPLLYSFETVAGFSQRDAERAVELYREYYEAGQQYHLNIYPGMPQLLHDLLQKGYRVGLASAKPDLFIQQILDRYQMQSLFDFAEGVSLEESYADKSELIRHVLRRLDVTKSEEALMIGDRKYDIDGAHKAEVHAAGVLYGFGSETELRAAGAECIFPTVEDIRSYLL